MDTGFEKGRAGNVQEHYRHGNTCKRIVYMPKDKLTLTVDPALLEKIKIQAVRDKRSVSNITEEMWRLYLKWARDRRAEAQ